MSDLEQVMLFCSSAWARDAGGGRLCGVGGGRQATLALGGRLRSYARFKLYELRVAFVGEG